MLAHWGATPPMGLPKEKIGHFNASPGARHWTFRERADGRIVGEPIRWEYLSPWAAKKKMRPAINARLDKLLTPYYRGLMKTGRIIVPADGRVRMVRGQQGSQQRQEQRPALDRADLMCTRSDSVR